MLKEGRAGTSRHISRLVGGVDVFHRPESTGRTDPRHVMMVSVVGPFIERSILVLPFHNEVLLIGQLSRVNLLDNVESGHLSFGWRAVVEGAMV